MRLLGRHDDALDIVQDVFLRWAEQCRREVPAHPRGWLRRVTVNRVIDARRDSMTLQRHADQVARPVADAGAPTIDQERCESVRSALQSLTETQRSVIVAKVWDGLSFAQIAHENGWSLSTVKTHYFRGLAHMQKKLK